MNNGKDRQRPRQRRSRGTILALVAASTMCIAMGFIAFSSAVIYTCADKRVAQATQAAALAAATSISTIVIHDPHFGYVSLSDWPGAITLDPAGEPIPVLGINTILATCRFNLLVAQQLGNPYMTSLAVSDAQLAAVTSQTLDQAVANSLAALAQKPQDKDGNVVDAYSVAKSQFLANMPSYGDSKFQLQSFNVNPGYLSGYCSSLAAVPQPATLSQLGSTLSPDNNYQAFVNVPVQSATANFYFAGLCGQTALVDARQFLPADALRVSSIVQVQAKVDFTAAEGWHTTVPIDNNACAMPCSNANLTPPAVLTLSLSSNWTSQIGHFSDLMTNSQLAGSQLDVCKVTNGDIPNPGAVAVIDYQWSPSGQLPVSQIVTRGLYDWLRTCHNKARLDAVLTMISQALPPTAPGTTLSIGYNLNPDGTVSSQIGQTYQYTYEFDQQETGNGSISIGNSSGTFNFRDEVTRLGSEGGLHAGRPLIDQQAADQYQEVYPINGLAVDLEFS